MSTPDDGNRRRIPLERALLYVLAAAVVFAAWAAWRTWGPERRAEPGLRLVWRSGPLPGALSGGGALSMDGSQAVLSLRQGSGDAQLWLVTPSTCVPLAEAPTGESPDWRPGGQEVAYLVLGENASELRVVDVGLRRDRAVSSPRVALQSEPRWSHSGEWIATAANLGDEKLTPAIVLGSPRGSAARVVAVTDPLAIASPWARAAWSADDTMVAVALKTFSEKAIVPAVWRADLRTNIAQALWMGAPLARVFDVGFGKGPNPWVSILVNGRAGSREALMLYQTRIPGQSKRVQMSVGAEGWMIMDAKLFPDGQGMVSMAVKEAGALGPNREAVLAWSRPARRRSRRDHETMGLTSGRLPFPKGYTAGIVGWSGDGHRLAIYRGNASERRVEVYEFE